MNRFITVVVILALVSSCSSTGPSQTIRDELIVINTLTGGIHEAVSLNLGGACDLKVSSEGDFLYLLRSTSSHHLLRKMNLDNMSIVNELAINGNDVCKASFDVTDNDFLLLVSYYDEQGIFYKINTTDMSIVDSLSFSDYLEFGISARPNTNLAYISWYDSPILVLDWEQMLFTDTLSIPHYKNTVYFSDSGDEMYLQTECCLFAYDPDTGEQLRSQVFDDLINRVEVPRGSNSMFISSMTMPAPYQFRVYEVDRASFSIINSRQLTTSASGLRYAESVSRLFLYPNSTGDIRVYDMPGFNQAGVVDVENYVVSMVMSPISDRLFCHIYSNYDQDIGF